MALAHASRVSRRLALGQCTPRLVSVVTAYIGYKIAGLAGACVAAIASFLPPFLLILATLPMFDRVCTLGWIAAAMRRVGPAVGGMFAVTLARMAPHALPGLWAVALLVATVIALVVYGGGPVRALSRRLQRGGTSHWSHGREAAQVFPRSRGAIMTVVGGNVP